MWNHYPIPIVSLDCATALVPCVLFPNIFQKVIHSRSTALWENFALRAAPHTFLDLLTTWPYPRKSLRSVAQSVVRRHRVACRRRRF